MLIIGGDIGHKNAKICYGDSDEELDIFRATIADKDANILSEEEPIIINYSGREIAVGTKYGAYSVEDDKSNDEVFKICLLTGIARSMKNNIEDISLVTGLPVNYYKRFKDSLIGAYVEKTFELDYLGITKKIKIRNLKPYPESAGIVILDREKYKGSYIVIDIGGRTVDVSYFEGTKLIKTGSYDLGMLSLYSTVVKFINDRYSTDYNVQSGETIISSNMITVDGVDIPFDTRRLLKEHAEEILRRVRLDFPWKTSKRGFIGGGSLDLRTYLPNGNKIGISDIFTNSKVFYRIGVEKYGSD